MILPQVNTAEHRADLIEQVDALLAIDAAGTMVPHGIGGLARDLLTRCRDEIARTPRTAPTVRTRVRQNDQGWGVDRLWLRLMWLPIGRWVHQDWWCPYVFETADEASKFAVVFAEAAP